MLISCAAYQDGAKIGDITLAHVPEYLHRLQCFVLVALDEPAADELAAMQSLYIFASKKPNGCSRDCLI